MDRFDARLDILACRDAGRFDGVARFDSRFDARFDALGCFDPWTFGRLHARLDSFSRLGSARSPLDRLDNWIFRHFNARRGSSWELRNSAAN